MNELAQIDLRITPKQYRLLEVLSNPEYATKNNEEKSKLAGIGIGSFYRILKEPNFIQAIRLRGLSEVIALSNPIIKKMGRDALSGKYMQQKTMLEMSGHLAQTPLIQQVIANITKSGLTEEEVDKKIAEYFSKDIPPVVVDVSK